MVDKQPQNRVATFGRVSANMLGKSMLKTYIKRIRKSYGFLNNSEREQAEF